MSIEQVLSFKTSDGQTFASLADAEAHEAVVSALPIIQKYAASKAKSPMAQTRIINAIREWEAFKAQGAEAPEFISEAQNPVNSLAA